MKMKMKRSVPAGIKYYYCSTRKCRRVSVVQSSAGPSTLTESVNKRTQALAGAGRDCHLLQPCGRRQRRSACCASGNCAPAWHARLLCGCCFAAQQPWRGTQNHPCFGVNVLTLAKMGTLRANLSSQPIAPNASAHNAARL